MAAARSDNDNKPAKKAHSIMRNSAVTTMITCCKNDEFCKTIAASDKQFVQRRSAPDETIAPSFLCLFFRCVTVLGSFSAPCHIRKSR